MTEPVRISDWLASYKLSDYIPVFEASGYDTTDFLKGTTTDELTEIGVPKPGHRKKIMTALAAIMHKEHLLMEKPVSVCEVCGGGCRCVGVWWRGVGEHGVCERCVVEGVGERGVCVRCVVEGRG